MEFSPIKLFHGHLETTRGQLYKSNTGETVIIKSIFVENAGTTNSKVNLYIAKEGETIDSSKSLFTNVTYEPSEKENIGGLFIALEAGDCIYGDQTVANSCVVYVSGVIQK